MTAELPKRETRCTIIRGAVAELRARQLFDAVRARASPEVQALMDNPPPPEDWIPSERFDEMQLHIGEVAGRDVVREIAYALTISSAGPLVIPIIKTVFKVFGRTPATLLKKLNTLTHLQFRGVEHVYEPETPRSGFVTLYHPYPVYDCAYAGWEGAYMFAKDMTGEAGYVVERFQLSEEGKIGRVHVHW